MYEYIMLSGGHFAKYWGGGRVAKAHDFKGGMGNAPQNCNYTYYDYKSEINWVLHFEIYYDYMEFPTIWLALQSECDLS
jgi:hypothetical protein